MMKSQQTLALFGVCLLFADVLAQQTRPGSAARQQQLEQRRFNERIKIAHAVFGSVAWVFFFPLGSILLRTLNGKKAVYTHAGIQVFSLVLLIVNAGLGIKLALNTRMLRGYHPIIGLVLFALVFLQAAGGIINHLIFRRKGRRTIVSHAHIWLGRVLITLGMINGGLGLKLANDSTRGQQIAYGVVAGVIWVVWVAVDVWALYFKRPVTPPLREKRIASSIASSIEDE